MVWGVLAPVVVWTWFCFLVAVLSHLRINKLEEQVDTLNAPEIQRIEAIELPPNDCMIEHFAGPLTPEEAAYANEALSRSFETNRIIVTDNAGKGVVSTEVLRGLQ